MSYWTQWELYGKHADGRLLAEAQVEPLLEALSNISDEWQTSAPDGETLCAFMTDYSSGYESTSNAVADFSKTMSDAVFLLKCHNTDEDWYQHIYVQNGEREAIDGYIAYDEPHAIRYDAPSPSELLIVLQGGIVQGVSALSPPPVLAVAAMTAAAGQPLPAISSRQKSSSSPRQK